MTTTAIKSTPMAGSTMTDEVKKVIDNCIELKMKPLVIIDKLTVVKLPVPKPNQISNYITKIKALKYGPQTLQLSDLRTILEAFTTPTEIAERSYVLCDQWRN